MEVTKAIKLRSLDKEKADDVSRILHDVWGIRDVEVNVDTHEAIVSFNEDSASLHDFEQALLDSGYHLEDTK